MAQIRSYTSAFEIVDYTQELNVVPNSWTLLGDMGLFQKEMLSTHTVTFEERDKSLALIGDQMRGAKPSANKDELRKIHSYPIPHFPDVDYVVPQDIQGKRAYGSATAAETLDGVIARKLERLKRNISITQEVARFKTLTTGNVYAPNGTITGNFFTDFGLTQLSVDFLLGTPGTDVLAKVESVIAAMQDTAVNGDVITQVVAFCSPEWFAKLISHAKVQTAYQYYTATDGQSILRNRAGNFGGMGALYREFYFGGIRFIEIRTSLGGVRLVPAGEATFVPLGTVDSFCSFFGPANKLDLVNTIAEESYAFMYKDPKGENMQIDTEFNVINIIRRPNLVIKGTTST